MGVKAGTPEGLSRRGFLTRLGTVGGASALYAGMESMGFLASPANAESVDFHPPRRGDLSEAARQRMKVFILGAGTAGLVAAYELQQAGYECHILEARDRPGGRARTYRGGDKHTDTDGVTQEVEFAQGQYFNAGPARIPNHHVTLEYCRKLGVKIEALVNSNAEAYYFHENTGTTDYGELGGTPVRNRQAKADWYGYLSELLVKAVDQGALDEVLSVDDAERLVSFANNFGALEGGEYVGTSRRGYLEPPGAGTNSGVIDGPPPPMSTVLQSELGNRFSFEFGFDQAMMMWQPVGGMDRIAVALADAVGRGNITYNAWVTEIANTSDGVRVTYQGKGARPKTVEANHCIVTIPPMVLQNIDSNLSEDTKDALAVPVGANTGKIGLQYRRRFWEEDEQIFGGLTQTNMDISNIWYPSYGYLGEKGVIVGYYSGAFTDLSVSERVERAVAQGEKIHGPAYRDELETAFSIAWPKVPEALGGWVNWPGGRGAAYEHLLQPDGNVYFAGDHLSYYIAWQAGAIESARLAVMELHKRVAASQ